MSKRWSSRSLAVEVSDDELAVVGLVGDAVFEACGQELVEAEEQDAVAGARHALGGFDGEEGLARPCPAVDEDARGVVEDVEDDALLLGELVELLADVVEEGVGGGDEVEVASEVVGDGVDGLGLERGAFVAGLGGAGVLGEAVDVAREGVGRVAGVVDEVAVGFGGVEVEDDVGGEDAVAEEGIGVGLAFEVGADALLEGEHGA